MKTETRKLYRESHPSEKIPPQAFLDLWNLANQFFERTEDEYREDLKSLDKVVLFRGREDGGLKGYVSIKYFSVEKEGKKIFVIFTEDAYFLSEHRGGHRVQFLGLSEYLRLRLCHLGASIIWAFPSVSQKGYLLMHGNFHQYWPRDDRPTPAGVQELMDLVGRWVDWAEWDSEKGLLRARRRERIFCEKPMTPRTELVRAAQFLKQKNPGCAEGDCLLCIVPLTYMNMGFLMLKMAYRGFRRIRQNFRP